MKSLIRWSAILGIVGSTLVVSPLINHLQALALTEEQVFQKLRFVPVFMIIDAKGAPLVATNPQRNDPNQTTSVAGVFISQKDAQASFNKLKMERPEIGNSAQVTPVSLGEVYKLMKQDENKPNGLNFAFIPVTEQVISAQALLSQSGQPVSKFLGTPLFVAKVGSTQEYLPITQNGQVIIPFFFDKEQLEEMIQRFKQQKPELASTIKIEVVPLEGIIKALETSNNQQLNKIFIVPSRETNEFLRRRSPSP